MFFLQLELDYDNLYAYDGRVLNCSTSWSPDGASEATRSFTGFFTSPLDVVLYNSVLSLHFTSDYDIVYEGFQVVVRAVGKGDASSERG